MNQKEFCQQFDFLEFVREHPQEIEPFALELNASSVFFPAAGVVEFKPNKPSNSYIVLSIGIHGNETAPIEIVSQLISDLLIEKLELSVNLLILLGSPLAMLQQERFISYNLNRLFMGQWQERLKENPDCYEALRAKFLEQKVTEFYSQSEKGHKRYHYDLHTAIKPSLHQRFAIYPFVGNRKRSNGQVKFMLDCGIDTVLYYHKTSTTFSYFSSETFKADAFTLELGKVRPFGENNLDDFSQAKQGLEAMVSGVYKIDEDADISAANLYQVKKELLKTNSTDVLAFENNVANFTAFNQGDLLLDAGANSYLVESDFESVVFPNNDVPIGQRMALVLEKI